jgi:hypothetical protein
MQIVQMPDIEISAIEIVSTFGYFKCNSKSLTEVSKAVREEGCKSVQFIRQASPFRPVKTWEIKEAIDRILELEAEASGADTANARY